MKRILKSSNFWNAVICSFIMVITAILTDGDIKKDLILYEFILFGGRTAVTGFGDILKASKGVTYNEKNGKEELIK